MPRRLPKRAPRSHRRERTCVRAHRADLPQLTPHGQPFAREEEGCSRLVSTRWWSRRLSCKTTTALSSTNDRREASSNGRSRHGLRPTGLSRRRVCVGVAVPAGTTKVTSGSRSLMRPAIARRDAQDPRIVEACGESRGSCGCWLPHARSRTDNRPAQAPATPMVGRAVRTLEATTAVVAPAAGASPASAVASGPASPARASEGSCNPIGTARRRRCAATATANRRLGRCHARTTRRAAAMCAIPTWGAARRSKASAPHLDRGHGAAMRHVSPAAIAQPGFVSSSSVTARAPAGRSVRTTRIATSSHAGATPSRSRA